MPDDHAGDPPEPPEAAPKYLVEGLEKQEAATLRAIARYAGALADRDHNVLFVDLDAQGNGTIGLGFDASYTGTDHSLSL